MLLENPQFSSIKWTKCLKLNDNSLNVKTDEFLSSPKAVLRKNFILSPYIRNGKRPKINDASICIS